MFLNNGDPSSRRALRQLRSGSLNDENAMVNRNKNSLKEKSISFTNNNANENVYLSKKIKKSMGVENTKSKLLLASSKASSTKKQNRRAFGDISNRKQNNGGGTIEITKTGTKSKGLSFKTPHKNKKHNSSTTGQRSALTPFGCTVNKNSIISKSQSQKITESKFVLPQRTVSFEQRNNNISEKKKCISTHNSTVHQRVNVVPKSPVEDVEYPAGRLWHQQQALLEEEKFHSSFDFSQEISDIKDMLEEERLAEIDSEERRRKNLDSLFDSKVNQYAEDREIEEISGDMYVFSSQIDGNFANDIETYGPSVNGLDDDFFFNDDISV